MPRAVKQHRWAGGRAVFALGVFIFLFGVPLVIGGVQLVALGGAWTLAVDPVRGVIVANYNDMPNFNRLVPRAEADRLGWYPRHDPRAKENGAEGAGDPQIGVPYAIDVNAGRCMPFTGFQANPMSYEIDGRQYIVIMTGGHHFMETPIGDHVVAYALPVRD